MKSFKRVAHKNTCYKIQSTYASLMRIASHRSALASHTRNHPPVLASGDSPETSVKTVSLNLFY